MAATTSPSSASRASKHCTSERPLEAKEGQRRLGRVWQGGVPRGSQDEKGAGACIVWQQGTRPPARPVLLSRKSCHYTLLPQGARGGGAGAGEHSDRHSLQGRHHHLWCAGVRLQEWGSRARLAWHLRLHILPSMHCSPSPQPTVCPLLNPPSPTFAIDLLNYLQAGTSSTSRAATSAALRRRAGCVRWLRT